MPEYSVIVPVFNRPDEIKELLESLVKQSFKDFDVLIIEDGSTNHCENVVSDFQKNLNVKYYFKENTGQGFSRNYGFERAEGKYFIVFDSDCIIPEHYFQSVHDYLAIDKLDAFGGPDKAHPSFTAIQKAISFSMTSLFTTGGIRGNKKHVGTFHPRSFNMGISKQVYQKTGGYILPKKGEDIEFSIRIIKMGFSTGLIPEAYVYHKRRTNYRQFFDQLHFFGTARINIGRIYPSEVKVIHAFPSFFVFSFLITLGMCSIYPWIGLKMFGIYVIYFVALMTDALLKKNGLLVSFLGAIAGFVQLFAYGIGFIREGMRYLLGDKSI